MQAAAIDTATNASTGSPKENLDPVVKESFTKDNFTGEVVNKVFSAILEARMSEGKPIFVVPVVQSSGWGKTRALIQCALANKAYVLYFNARHDGHGWPSPSPFTELAEVIKPAGPLETYASRCEAFKMFFTAQIEHLERTLSVAPMTPTELFSDMYEWSNDKFDYGQHFHSTMAVEPPLHGTSVSTAVSSPGLAPGCDTPIFLVLDEASTLTGNQWQLIDGRERKNAFLAARRAAVEIIGQRQSRRDVLLVPVATASSLEHVAPPEDSDPSLRSGGHSADAVLRFFENMDVLAPTNIRLPIPSKSGEREDCKDISRLGRPLWGTNDTCPLFAAQKLLGSFNPSKSWGSADQITKECKAAAITGALCGCFVLPQTQVSTLVEYNMCTATAVSGNIMHGEYVSEPALAAGARHCLRRFASPEDVIALQQDTFSRAPANAGDLGELVCVLALLECMEEALKASVDDDEVVHIMYPVVTMRELAKQIIPAQCLVEADFPDDSYVSYNHFVRLPKDLFGAENRGRAGYRRCAGIVANVNEAVVDGEIPVLAASDKVQRWCFQVKNRKEPRQPFQGEGDFPMLFIEMGSSKPVRAARYQAQNVYYFSLWDMPIFGKRPQTGTATLKDSMQRMCGFGRRERLRMMYKS